MKIFILFISLISSAHAMFARIETTEIPINNIIKNLEKKETPKNLSTSFQLARAYALAATMNSLETIKSSEDKLADGMYGSFDSVIPKFEGKKKTASEVKFYKKSKNKYDFILQKDPKNYQFLLGRGWVNLQLGNTQQAREDFMKIIDDVKPKTNTKNSSSPLKTIRINSSVEEFVSTKWDFELFHKYYQDTGTQNGFPLISETIDYLEPLLSKNTKDQEILKKLISLKEYAVRGYAMTPIIFPITEKHAYSELKNDNHYVMFNLDGVDRNTKWQWIKKDAAFLVYLGKSKKKLVESGRELFGNATFWIFWNNGYEAMSSLDNDGDQYLSQTELDGIFVWHDINEDGICTSSEIFDLEKFGIKKIATKYAPHKDNIDYNPHGLILKDGKTIPTYDWVSRRSELKE